MAELNRLALKNDMLLGGRKASPPAWQHVQRWDEMGSQTSEAFLGPEPPGLRCVHGLV